VERVHAEGNRVLAAHGPFNGNSLHKQATAGSSEHHNNMEAMAEEVRQCINQATFGRNPLFSYRGVKEFTFSDEEALQNLLTLSEKSKSDAFYASKRNPILDEICKSRGIRPGFERELYQGLQTVAKFEVIVERTSCRDKYTTVLYSPTLDFTGERYELQSVLEYIRWVSYTTCH